MKLHIPTATSDPYRFEGQDDDSASASAEITAYAAQEEAQAAAQAAAKAAIATTAIAASGEIPEGWTYAGPVRSSPTRQERKVGVSPRIIGALVTRPAVVVDRSGIERAEIIAGGMGEIRFFESEDSKSVRADIYILEFRAFVAGFSTEITVSDTGNNDVSEYTVYSGPTAVIRHTGFSWPLDALAKSGSAVTGAEFAINIGRAGVWVRI